MGAQFEADVTLLSPNDSGPRDPRSCSLIIVHTNEGPPDGPVEGLLGYLARPSAQASYTIVVGGDGRIGRSNDDGYVPWAAGSPANERGLHLCFMGRASQTRAEWLSRPAQLAAGARVARDWSDRYGIPLVKLSGAQMRAEQRGVGGHNDTVDAWHATDHTDPGSGFPWDVLLANASGIEQEDQMPTPEEIAKAVWAHRPPKPDGKTDATAGEMLAWTDQHSGLALDQLAGPGSKDQPGGLDPTRWDFLGDRSVPEALGLIGAKLGIPRFRDPLEGTR